MKRWITALLALLLLLSACTACAAAYRITGNRVRVRTGRGTSFDILGRLYEGQVVEVENIKNGWAKIKYDASPTGYGYISEGYIEPTNLTPTPRPAYTPAPVPGVTYAFQKELADMYSGFRSVSYYAIVQGSSYSQRTNMRWAPSTSAPIMGVRNAGYMLLVLSENGTWCQVYDPQTGECGFMSARYLQRVLSEDDING